jgi:glycosyltransferase involved in cell wall biosynthesis
MESRVRVLFMQSQTYFGADSMIHSLLMRYLDRESVEVHVACNPGSRRNRSASITALERIPDLHLLPTVFGPTVNATTKLAVAKATFTGLPPMLVSFARLLRYIKRHQIDIIDGTEKPRDAFYGLLLARLTGAKMIVHVHAKPGKWMSPLTRWAMRRADALIGVSAFVAEVLRVQGYPAAKIHHVLNSLDVGSRDAGAFAVNADGAAIRQEFQIEAGITLLAVVSRLFPWKGHTQLLEALARVKETSPAFKLLIVGEDDPRATPGGGSYRADLKKLVQELDLTQHVIFTGFRSDVANIMAACDVFAMPSFEEPFGVVYLEAMSLGKPIIGLDKGINGGGGTREVVDNGKGGLLSAPGDIEQLARNIATLIDDPELRRRMGAYGRMRIEQYFTPSRMADETMQIYYRILGCPETQKPS